MEKRIRISNDRVNSYGTRILTSGMDIEQYNRNPVLLYMHQRGQVIGIVKELRKEGDEITGELLFDEVTELSRLCKKQYTFGSLKMVSVGIDIIEESDAPEHLLPGQTRPTITKSKLFEVSLVDIGANDDAIVLQKDGKRIQLGKDGGQELPLLHSNNNNNHKKTKQMDQEKLALELGLPKDADETTIMAELGKLKADGAEAQTLRQERDALRAARIENLVDAAIAEKKIGEDKKQQFLDLGKKIGAEELEQTFAAMSPQVKLSHIVTGVGTTTVNHGEYKKLSDVPTEELSKMRDENPALYKKLYKAEYGMECEI